MMQETNFSYRIECDSDLWNSFYKEQSQEEAFVRKAAFIFFTILLILCAIILVIIDQRFVNTYIAIFGGLILIWGILCLMIPYRYKPAKSGRPVIIEFTPTKVVVDGDIYSWTSWGGKLEKVEVIREKNNLIFVVSYPGKRKRYFENYYFPYPSELVDLAEKIAKDYRQAWSLN